MELLQLRRLLLMLRKSQIHREIRRYQVVRSAGLFVGSEDFYFSVVCWPYFMFDVNNLVQQPETGEVDLPSPNLRDPLAMTMDVHEPGGETPGARLGGNVDLRRLRNPEGFDTRLSGRLSGGH
jgi:hypothetical protein